MYVYIYICVYIYIDIYCDCYLNPMTFEFDPTYFGMFDDSVKNLDGEKTIQLGKETIWVEFCS